VAGNLFIAFVLSRLNSAATSLFGCGLDSSSPKAVSDVSRILVPDLVGDIRLSDVHARTFTICI
jgi:hypothetical protein